MRDVLSTIVDFLNGNAIPALAGVIPDTALIPGVTISRGTVVFDPSALRWPGDLLHEAGHIAVTPAPLRPLLDGALESSVPAPYATEIEAIAWSYAAAVHLGLDAAIVFHPEGYRGKSSALLFTFSLGVFPGAHGLAQAGMTLIGAEARNAGVQPYPHMLQWLRT